MHRRFGGVDRQPIHHLDGRRHDAAADDRRDGFAGFVDRVEPASSVSTASGRRSSRSVAFGDDRQRAFRSDDSTPSRSRPGRVERGPAERHELAVGQHRFDAEHVVDGEAVLQAVRAARVLGDVAADRADDLARRIGRVVAAGRRDALCVISRFVTPGSTVTRRLGMSTSRMRFSRESTISTPSGCGSAPPDSPVPWPRATNGTPCGVAEPHDRLHLRGARRQHDRARDRAQVHERVGLVGQQVGRLAEETARPDGARKVAAEAGIDHRMILSPVGAGGGMAGFKMRSTWPAE